MVPPAAAANAAWPRAEPPGSPAVVREWRPTLQPEWPGEPPAARMAAADQMSSRQIPGGELPLPDALLGLARGEGHIPDVGRPANIQNIDDKAVIHVFIATENDGLIRIELCDAGQRLEQLLG